MKQYVSEVDAVILCLGHNLTFKGIFGKPHTLVVDALIKIVNTIDESNKTVKIILMNTTACINELQNEKFKKN